MIVPSIDIMDGVAVQLVEGKTRVIDAGDPLAIAERFRAVGEIAVIDLDAAMGRGDNADLIQEILKIAECRIGGGVRTEADAVRWLDAGATSVIIGTAAEPSLLGRLPRERVIAALDARDNDVVVEGWRRRTGATVEERIDALRECVGGYLVTFVEGEGRMGGLPIDRVREIVSRAGPVRVTAAGGTSCADDIRLADDLGADVQVGMALYTGRMDLAAGFCAPLKSDREDGLWPTIVVDDRGSTLGLVYSSLESVRESLRLRRGVYHSRRRGMWMKGEQSGDVQELIRIDADCDRDALRFTVRQRGAGFCHTGSATCFGRRRGLGRLQATLDARLHAAPRNSYTRRLIDDASLLESKLIEEARELASSRTAEEAAAEAADLMFFTLVAASRRGATLADIERILDERAGRITRRPGDAKETPCAE